MNFWKVSNAHYLLHLMDFLTFFMSRYLKDLFKFCFIPSVSPNLVNKYA